MDTINLEQKNWNILIPYYGNELSDIALQEGISLCKVFNSGIVLFQNNANEEEKIALVKLATHINSKYGLRVESYAPQGKTDKLLFALAKKTETILIIIGHNKSITSLGKSISSTLRKLRKSRTPFLMTPQALHSRSFKDVVYVMGYLKQEKEKILWASYFGRIYKSNINVIVPNASDQFFKTGVNGNMATMEKLYKNIDITHENIPLKFNIHKIYKEAIIYARDKNAGAFITLSTLRPDIFDFFGGSIEKKLICNKHDVPILCINPRDDLYILCN